MLDVNTKTTLLISFVSSLNTATGTDIAARAVVRHAKELVEAVETAIDGYLVEEETAIRKEEEAALRGSVPRPTGTNLQS